MPLYQTSWEFPHILIAYSNRDGPIGILLARETSPKEKKASYEYEKEASDIRSFKEVDFSDIPEMTDGLLAELQPHMRIQRIIVP